MITYAGKELEFIGNDSRMLKNKFYKIIRDTICFDAEGEKYWDGYYSVEPEETRDLTVIDERNHFREFSIENFKTL